MPAGFGPSLDLRPRARGSQLESRQVFDLLEALKIGYIIAWRRMKGEDNPPDVLTVEDHNNVEGPKWIRVVYNRLRAVVEGFNGRTKSWLA